MTSFAIEIKNPKQAEALFAFLKTLDSITVSKLPISQKGNLGTDSLNDEMKQELDKRKNSIGKVKTYKASEAISYARKKIKSRN